MLNTISMFVSFFLCILSFALDMIMRRLEMRESESAPFLRSVELKTRRACDDQECYNSCRKSGSFNECYNNCCR